MLLRVSRPSYNHKQSELLTARMQAANINPETGLATDYLNHFNEVSMLIEMLTDMPEMLEEARAWQPYTYQEHFQASGFSEAAFIIDCYNQATPVLKKLFDDQSKDLTAVIQTVLEQARPDEPRWRQVELPHIISDIQERIGRLYGLVHGHQGLDQTAVDAELGQDAIDDLFD